MIKIKRRFLLISVLSISINLLAEEKQSENSIETEKIALSIKSDFRPKWNLTLDAADLLLKGAGIETNYGATDKLSFGVYGKGFKLMSEDYDKSVLGTKHEAQEYGSKLSYYSEGFQNEGWVMALALGQIKVKSTGKANFDKYDMSDMNWEKSVTKTMTETQGYLAYQFLGQHFSESTRFVFRGGIGYGTGGRMTVNYGGTKSEINDGLLFDLNGGVQF
jgi:hypothetical protein